MGIIETEFTEIRQLTKAVLAGTIDKETAALALKGYAESGKRTDQYIKVLSLGINHGNKAMNRIISKNIISEGVAIDTGNQIEEKIKCPEHGGCLIDRGQCLDYSGLERNLDKCQQCEQFSVTRKYMMP